MAEDPHVERLIEAFAYLNARTRHKLDDDFPEITDAMLGVLYPHYQAPIPAMAVVQFALDRGQGDLTDRLHDSPPRHAGNRADRRRAVPLPHLLSHHPLAGRVDRRQPDRPAVRRAAHRATAPTPWPCCASSCSASARR